MFRPCQVVVEGSEDLKMTSCTFTRLDGNAVILTGYNRAAEISESEFSFIGDSAIALWGLTKQWDGTDGTQPRGTKIIGNFIHELGCVHELCA